MTAEARDPSSRDITAGDHRFRIGDQTAALYGAAMHYWRLDRDAWATILDRLSTPNKTVA